MFTVYFVDTFFQVGVKIVLKYKRVSVQVAVFIKTEAEI